MLLNIWKYKAICTHSYVKLLIPRYNLQYISIRVKCIKMAYNSL